MANSTKILLVEESIFSIQSQINHLNADVQRLQELVGKLKIEQTNDDTQKNLPDSSCLKKDANNLSIKNGFVYVYTAGAYISSGLFAKAGLGVWFGPDHKLNLSEPVRHRVTNSHVGDIEACTRALQVAYIAGIKNICINTDSNFLLNCMSWISERNRYSWRWKEDDSVVNKCELLELNENINLLDNVEWNLVQPYTGITGNYDANVLATKGALKYNMVHNISK